ncbi:MAG TPA: Arc family DNA-binding protein [Ktedonobacteraceae bacterium]|nr:Arc family DNA-binding protein [Ktedonobacteraceae bacterium]
MLLKRYYYSTMKRQLPDSKIISTNTRYPKELHEAMVRLAQKHKRSLNAEVMWALQVYVEQQEGKASRKILREEGLPHVPGETDQHRQDRPTR